MNSKLFVLFALVGCAFAASIPDGLVPVHTSGRIVGGTNVPITSAPWQLALQYFGSHRCGASLIYNSIAISSGACVNGTNIDNLLLRGGSDSIFQGVYFGVADYYIHPYFDEATFDYDVSIIYLTEAIDYTDYINAVPLAPKGYPLTPDSLVTITGWGAQVEGGPFATNLQGALIPVIDHDDCNEAYQDYGGITPRQFCAGFLRDGGVDVCTGDAGSPATLSDTLVGIASWGYACGRPGVPGVYTSISAVREWIDDMMV